MVFTKGIVRMGSYVVTQKKIVRMKWKNYKTRMLENKSASVIEFFLSFS